VGGFVATWRQSVFAPSTFFRAMPRNVGIGSALVYFLLVGIGGAGIQLFWQLTLFSRLAGDTESPLAALAFAGDDSPLTSFLMTPLVLLASLAITTLIVHFVLWIIGGARHGLGTTTRVFAFAFGPQLFVIIPILGALLALFWMLWLSVIGLREAHGTETWRAALAVLLPAFAMAALFLLMMLVLIATGGGALPGGLPVGVG
jgi:hypothetical protein